MPDIPTLVTSLVIRCEGMQTQGASSYSSTYVYRVTVKARDWSELL